MASGRRSPQANPSTNPRSVECRPCTGLREKETWKSWAALVEGSANPNLPNKAGKTPVALAAESGQLEVLEFLVGKGGDIAHTDEIGGTPLLWAVALSKNPATAEYLVEQGASVNVVDKSGMTPLIWAAGIGQPESVALLVKNGADLDAVEIHAKETALMRAARIGNPASVRILLDADADTEIKNMLGQTAVMIAVRSGPARQAQDALGFGSGSGGHGCPRLDGA